MIISRILELKKGSMVSIVGAGGKSTLMYTIAEELRKDFKVLITTTTKIFVPNKEQFDFIEIGNSINEYFHSSKSGIYVNGSSVNLENKLIGIETQILEGILSYYDYILVESDGSKRKDIKGWNDKEPVICKDTTKTIGVLSIESIGKEINEDNVHRVQQFTKITDSYEGQSINKEHIVALIFHNHGLFKNSVGQKILFINKVESEEEIKLAHELASLIIEKNKTTLLLDKVIFGSLKNKNYFKFNLH
jgi:probable selenium-dependent hydroxylase accessory protein YqeC